MARKNRSQGFRLENINDTKNYLIEEINWNGLVSKNHKKVCTTLNHIEHSLILGSKVTECSSISALASLVTVPIGFTSSTIGLRICAITAAIKKYKSKIKKKKKKYDKIVLLATSKLNTIEVIISKSLIHSVISHDEFVLINNVFKKYRLRKKCLYLEFFWSAFSGIWTEYRETRSIST